MMHMKGVIAPAVLQMWTSNSLGTICTMPRQYEMPQLALWPRKSALAPDVLHIWVPGLIEGVMKGAFAPDVLQMWT
jgi:hypothetical protein